MIKNKIGKGEIEKWLDKIEAVFPLSAKNEKGREFIKNIEAYISDCKHFMEKGDYVNSFEAIIWAWAWYEIGTDNGIIGPRK